MTRPCRDVEGSLGRPAQTLSQAERLVLEQHLAECVACRETNALARSITELVATAPAALTDAARERALAGAFARAAEGRGGARPARRGRHVALALVAAAVLAVGLRFTLQGPTLAGVIATQSKPTSPAAQSSRPVASAATTASAVPAPHTARSDDEWLEVAAVETLQFAHAAVTLDAGTRVRFDRTTNQLELARGRVLVDVEPARGATFAVLTQSFRVQVLGTQFAVTPERVEVLRGRVQVFGRDGALLARALGPGSSFEAGRVREPGSPAKRPRESTVVASAADLLARARLALAGSDVASARALVRQATALARSRIDRAEAGTLSAECALLERAPEVAIRAYLSVADRYRELPAGENALFAAAQLSAREQPEPTARALFELYLARYPHGHFVSEARSRMGERTR